ncbi:MAG: hypothetical protein IJ867_08490 [Clostridia bacterium]|nr:hypothetical protein [Clostridia bacterium]
MYTQIFNDGSNGLMTNAKLDLNQKKSLDNVVKGLNELTEPAKVMELVNRLVEQNILDGKDLRVLKEKGIIMAQEQTQTIEKQQQHEQEPRDTGEER